MNQLIAFTRKEYMEQIRTHRFTLMLIVFVLFGISSPALAKLTPMLYEMMSEEMTKQGILIQQAEVTALTAWAQYYKNIMIPLHASGLE